MRVEIHDPKGKLMRHYGTNLDTGGADTAVVFRPALNDPVGIWRAVAVDVTSGIEVSRTFTVRLTRDTINQDNK